MKTIELTLITNNQELAIILKGDINGNILNFNAPIEWAKKEEEIVFGNTLASAYKKLSEIANKGYPNQKYKIALDVEEVR